MINNKQTKAIIFDFFGVLLFQKENYSPSKIVKEIDLLIGGVTNDLAFKNQVMNQYGINEKSFEKILDDVVGGCEKFKPIWELLPQLRKNYKLAVINNGTALTLPRFNRRHSIYKNFDLFVSSAIEGIKKPDKKIYLLAAQRLNVLPNECLFMDDSKINIDGAKSVGMKTIWWKNKNQGFYDFLKINNLTECKILN